MRVSAYITGLVVAILSLPLLTKAGPSSEGGPQWIAEEHLGKPLFEMRLVQRLNAPGDPIRIDVMFNVMYDYLQFIRIDSSMFEASIEAALAVSKQDSGQVLKRVKNFTQQLPDFSKTNSRRDFISGLFQIELVPGKYSLELRISDRESKRGDSIKRDIVVPAPKQVQCDLSDLILARSSEIDPVLQYPREPTIEGITLKGSKSLYLFFDLLNNEPMVPCKIGLSLRDKSGAVVSQDSLSLMGGEALTRHILPLTFPQLTFGKYEARLFAESGTHRVEKTLFFDLNVNGLPGTISDLDEAIKQLKYIATDDEIKSIESQFPSEREAAFIAFWNEKFPVEGETVNGKMLEYYARASFANENFSGSTIGWETDRGHVMMLYGKPNEVERTGDNNTEPSTETWYYSSLGKRFLFRDDYGFGDYRLITPLW